MNDKARRAKYVSSTGVVEGRRRERENKFHKLDMMGHKEFFESGVKTEEGTLSKGVAKKDTQTIFEVEFVGRVRMQPGKT